MSSHNIYFYGEISKFILNYHKIPFLSVPLNISLFACPSRLGDKCKIWSVWFYDGVMDPKDADGIANSVNPDLTAGEAVCTVCPDCLSDNLGSLCWLSIFLYLQIYNNGPGTVQSADLTIRWPYEVASKYTHGKHLLYLMQQPQVVPLIS